MEVSLEGHLEDPGLHHKKINELETKIDINHELLIQLKGIEKRLDRIEDKLN